MIWFGWVSLLDKPYLPPTTSIFLFSLYKAATTSRYKGSPVAPASLVLSNTAILVQVEGNTDTNLSVRNGLYKCTFTKPTFSPRAFNASTVS